MNLERGGGVGPDVVVTWDSPWRPIPPDLGGGGWRSHPPQNSRRGPSKALQSKWLLRVVWQCNGFSQEHQTARIAIPARPTLSGLKSANVKRRVFSTQRAPREASKTRKYSRNTFLNASVWPRKSLNRNLSWGFPFGNLLTKTRVWTERNANVLGTLRFRTLKTYTLLEKKPERTDKTTYLGEGDKTRPPENKQKIRPRMMMVRMQCQIAEVVHNTSRKQSTDSVIHHHIHHIARNPNARLHVLYWPLGNILRAKPSIWSCCGGFCNNCFGGAFLRSFSTRIGDFTGLICQHSSSQRALHCKTCTRELFWFAVPAKFFGNPMARTHTSIETYRCLPCVKEMP